jgi:hypothetical protein
VDRVMLLAASAGPGLQSLSGTDLGGAGIAKQLAQSRQLAACKQFRGLKPPLRRNTGGNTEHAEVSGSPGSGASAESG